MGAANNVVRLSDHLEPPVKSQYELYPMPFFAAERRSTWAVQSTGDYAADFRTGSAYATEFLRSRDGSNRWVSLLAQIVGDMIRAGPVGVFPDGHPKICGITIGFMNVIGRALAELQSSPPVA
jgi:hypothetical protein